MSLHVFEDFFYSQCHNNVTVLAADKTEGKIGDKNKAPLSSGLKLHIKNIILSLYHLNQYLIHLR